jgi:hypothetical protein
VTARIDHRLAGDSAEMRASDAHAFSDHFVNHVICSTANLMSLIEDCNQKLPVRVLLCSG